MSIGSVLSRCEVCVSPLLHLTFIFPSPPLYFSFPPSFTLSLPHSFSLVLPHSRNNSAPPLIFSHFNFHLALTKAIPSCSLCHMHSHTFALPPHRSPTYLPLLFFSDSIIRDCSLFPCHPSSTTYLSLQCSSLCFLSFTILSLHLCSPHIL